MEVFLDFEHHPLRFSSPLAVIRCHELSSLASAFGKIEQALKKGFYAAGFVSYEAGYAFEDCLKQKHAFDFPLLMMGVYEKPFRQRVPGRRKRDFRVKDFRLNLSREQYGEDIRRIREHIAAGDVYQITYCIKFHFDFRGDPLALYAELLRRQNVPYPACVLCDEFKILSLSPERFIRKTGPRLLAEPMKGTWPRGKFLLGDVAARFNLWRDPKNRAENLMICDLLRNDLGRVGEMVNVPKLFTVAQYKTLYQMTSTVTARVRPDIPVHELFSALFPSGSVTGAPKIRAMQIIRQLEQEERRIYTGAIGYIGPGRSMYFNIPIRTVLIRGREAEMGVGGGIVWDSTAQGEWDEGLLKANFLTGMAGV